MRMPFQATPGRQFRSRASRALVARARAEEHHRALPPLAMLALNKPLAALRRSFTRQQALEVRRYPDIRNRLRLLKKSRYRYPRDRRNAFRFAGQALHRDVPGWVRVCALLAAAAGITHDLGKFGLVFQLKLASARPVADPVRHEWISLFVVRDLLDGKSWMAAWQDLAAQPPVSRWMAIEPFQTGLRTARDALLYLVATHHRLPAIRGNAIADSKHVRDRNHVPEAVAAPSPENLSRIAVLLQQVSALPARAPLYWRTTAIISRMALILADHAVSAELVETPPALAYANTDRATGRLNQPLDWHLEQVGTRAQKMVGEMLALQPPALSAEAVQRICRPIPEGSRFYWQEQASQALRKSRQADDCPHLVLNMAGTGSGKTRMNARAACELGGSNGNNVRFATALNLRTLTLQTGDAYKEQLEIPAAELGCVIGDTLTQALHTCQKSLMQSLPEREKAAGEMIVDDDENPPEADFQAASEFSWQTVPEWLDHFLRDKRRMAPVIGAPVLVSTIDFLIAAGEPQRQANHALAALRLMTSDLILDEIDGYDPKALLAVLRLVMMTALFGRNVIASSATLSEPVAKLLWQAYRQGALMRAELTGGAVSFKTALIDNSTAPEIGRHDSVAAFLATYNRHVQKMLACLAGQRYRVPVLVQIDSLTEADWLTAIRNQVLSLHDHHSQTIPGSDSRVSFGLIRIANIHVAVKVAGFLAAELPQARIVCYHAQHFPIQRFHIEQRLDYLLTRKSGDAHIWKDPEILEAVRRSRANGQQNTIFIVVATPVEEIGRDHDFDWAVIEPSSTQSIVQTAGRVDRHRLHSVRYPNVAILRYNYKTLFGEKQVFDKPGLECGDSHPHHDLAQLLDWEGGIEQIDARLRFERRHLFAVCDDRALQAQTDRLFQHAIGGGMGDYQWMGHETYTKAPLREPGGVRVELTLLDAGIRSRFMAWEEHSDSEPTSRNLKIINDGVPNTWLIKSDAELENMAQASRIHRDRALTVSARGPFLNSHNEPVIARHMSFGFYRPK